MRGSCNGCGDCCAAVTLRAGVMSDTVSGRTGPAPEEAFSDDYPNQRWMLYDLTELSREEAIARRPALAAWPEATWRREKVYACRHFDYATKRCTDYDNRPPICSGYPFYENYGREFDAQRHRFGFLDSLDCGFWADVPFWYGAIDGLAYLRENYEAGSWHVEPTAA